MDNFMEYGWEDEIVNEGGDFVLLPEGTMTSPLQSTNVQGTRGRRKCRPAIWQRSHSPFGVQRTAWR